MFNIIYATISFLSFGLVLLIFPWFIRFRSIPGLFACVWLLVVNFIFGLNAAAFTGDVLLRVPVYCDVVTKLLVGMQMAVPTAMLCYTFSIHDWLVRPKWRDLNDKFFVFRERFHVALCILMPIMYMVLHVAAQDHRFDLVEDLGCLPSAANTALSWFIIWQAPMVPFCIMAVFGFFALKYSWTHYRKYCDQYLTTWDMVNADLEFTKAPFRVFRIIRLSIMIALVMLWTVSTPFIAFVILALSKSMLLSQKLDLSRIDVFSSVSAATPSTKTMSIFLWSGPFYSVLLFAASIDRAVLLSYPYYFRKHILREPVGPRPDPSPGIDLSMLNPVPVRRRLHRRVIRESRQYDPPVSFFEYDIPLPPRPDPGYRSTTIPPPTPLSVLTIEELQVPEPVHVKEGRSSQCSRGPRRGSREYAEAINQHVESNMKFPMHPIPESPSSFGSKMTPTLEGHSTTDLLNDKTITNCGIV